MWRVGDDDQKIQMAEGDYGFGLPFTILETKITEHDSFKFVFKKQKNGEAMRRIFADDDELEGPQDCFYDDITVKDMIEQGMLEELAGRISISVNFHKLSEDDMRRLIRSKAEQISRERGIRIKLTDKAVDALMTVAYTNLGVRAPMNLMTELAFETLARHSIDNCFDRSRDMIVIEGKAKARVVKKKSSELDCI